MITSESTRSLSEILDEASARYPSRVAVEDESGRSIRYDELALMADRLATRLARWGVGPGDRVGLYLSKGIEAVVAIHGILRSGAAYVPIDPTAPAPRGAGILADGCVKAIVADAALAAGLRSAWPGQGPFPRLILVGEDSQATAPIRDAHWGDVINDKSPSPLAPERQSTDLAYILYTSGSTGRPKGVMLTHANAFTFIDWCDQTFKPNSSDRFSSHAPFHFDLSIFDLFVSCKAGATLVLIGECLAKEPARLVAFLQQRRLSVWYSAPSILTLMIHHGGLDHGLEHQPRLVLFAGEVFPIVPLKLLRSIWKHAELWNLYGPTETNVCTAQRIPPLIDESRNKPFPIGRVCPAFEARVVDDSGVDVLPGELGELVVSGPGVMRGYFRQTELTARSFFLDRDTGRLWYRTGDLVRDEGDGCFDFHGRRDRMVKKRGHRIELGEIESVLYRHEAVERAAVIAKQETSGLSIAAFVALKENRKGSIIALKRHCAEHMPIYMVPDSFTFVSNLPTTSTDKVDYQGLRMAQIATMSS